MSKHWLSIKQVKANLFKLIFNTSKSYTFQYYFSPDFQISLKLRKTISNIAQGVLISDIGFQNFSENV